MKDLTVKQRIRQAADDIYNGMQDNQAARKWKVTVIDVRYRILKDCDELEQK